MYIKNFDSEPNYCFSDNECGNTVLVWPDFVEGMGTCFRCREKMDGGEVFDYRIYGYDIPTTPEEFEEIMADITCGNGSALERL